MNRDRHAEDPTLLTRLEGECAGHRRIVRPGDRGAVGRLVMHLDGVGDIADPADDDVGHAVGARDHVMARVEGHDRKGRGRVLMLRS